MNTDRILRFPEVHARTGLSRTTIWREINAGRFPSQINITPHAVGWRESEVNAWIAARHAKAA